MLDLRVIEKSQSAYASPVVLVRKLNGSNRFCVDFRQWNVITILDLESIPNTEDLLSRVANAKYFSKIRLDQRIWAVNYGTTG